VKAFIVHLFFQEYSNLEIEQDIGDPRYFPDVVSFSRKTNEARIQKDEIYNRNQSTTTNGAYHDPKIPLFWGESGRMRLDKACELAIRYPDTHIVWIRWGISLEEFRAQVAPALNLAMKSTLSTSRTARYTLGAIPHRHLWNYVDPNNNQVHIRHEDVQWLELVDGMAE
jgi:hypothetical protein